MNSWLMDWWMHDIYVYKSRHDVFWRTNALKERRPQNIYSQEEVINKPLCIIKLATEMSLFSLQIIKT